jgi:hypothetical protein
MDFLLIRSLSEEVAKPPLTERTGWSGMEPCLINAFRNTSAISTTPSCAAAVASHLFINGAATPPISKGELPASHSFTPSNVD